MSDFQHILDLLPYGPDFLFVDDIEEINDQHIEASYTFKPEEYFYGSHFKERPITPGVILTECMAQIGLVAFGIHLLGINDNKSGIQVAFTASSMNFLRAVEPGSLVRVKATKKLWRLGTLRVTTDMYSADNELICHGELSGMITRKNNE